MEGVFAAQVSLGTAEADSPAGPSAEPNQARSPTASESTPALEVRSVPPLPGLSFRLFRPCSLYLPAGRTASEYCFSGDVPAPESWRFATDARGVARLYGPGPGLYHLQAGSWQSDDGSVQAEFTRWEDDVFTPERLVVLPAQAEMVVGMNLYRQVRLVYEDLVGNPTPADRVSQFVARSSFGSLLTLASEGPHWILAERSLRRDTGLESVPVVYAVQRVDLDGGNVVNRGQLRLVADGSSDRWILPLLLYSARFEPRDALFGGPVGGRIVIEFPDGSRHELATSDDHTADLSGLARGTYRVWVESGPGIVLTTIVVLSRDQVVRPPVVTFLDLVVVAGGGLGGALGLLFVGRPYLLRPGRKPVKPRLRAGSPRSGTRR